MTGDGVGLRVGLSAAILAVTDEQPRVVTVGRSEWGRSDKAALPFGILDAFAHRTLELGLRSWVQELAELVLGYTEQLYTFGDRDRVDRPLLTAAPSEDEERVISVAYLALTREAESEGGDGVDWRDIYRFLPWEDGRGEQPSRSRQLALDAIGRWCRKPRARAERERREERAQFAFGLDREVWDSEKVLERYELLFEAGLVAESDPDGSSWPDGGFSSRPMAADHRRILATALGRLRAKIKYRPVIFELMPEQFTLFELQRTVEALAGLRLHKQNFRRLIDRGGLVELTGGVNAQTGGRPAKLYAFRRDVLRERRAPGVGLPGQR